MNWFKNAVNFLVMLCVFLCLIYIYNDKKAYGEPRTNEDTGEVTNFYDEEHTEAYIKLAVLFSFSALVTAISHKKFPIASLVAAALPVWHCLVSLRTVSELKSLSSVGADRLFTSNDLLNRRPMFFVFFAVLNFGAAIVFIAMSYRQKKGCTDDGYCDFDEQLPEPVDPEYVDEDEDETIDFTKIV